VLFAACCPIPGHPTRPGAYLAGSFGSPFAEFFRRFGRLGALILALICIYRLSDFVLNIMNPFYLDLGFTKTELAEVRKVFGVVATTVGVFLAGWSVARLGVLRTLVIGAFVGPISNLVFAWLATQGSSLTALFIAIGVDNSSGGFAGTALIVYMSSLTSLGFTATQYALFSSLYALPGKLLASQSGRIVEASARQAEAGGFAAPLLGLFDRLPAGTLAKGAQTAGVAPAALGAGYIAFFLYTAAIGIAAIALTFIVVARQGRARPAISRSGRRTPCPPRPRADHRQRCSLGEQPSLSSRPQPRLARRRAGTKPAIELVPDGRGPSRITVRSTPLRRVEPGAVDHPRLRPGSPQLRCCGRDDKLPTKVGPWLCSYLAWARSLTSSKPHARRLRRACHAVPGVSRRPFTAVPR
jgi:hypothetical protein